jgi:Arc/MetJ-type ribon-helix-helix transcriptional regulator
MPGGALRVVATTNIKTRRRWTDTAIEIELRAQIDALGHFPSRAELVARGLRSLWEAMRSSAGVDAWRERVHDRPSAPSRAQIAARAYELYEQGAAGDADAHWLAAEQELTRPSQ